MQKQSCEILRSDDIGVATLTPPCNSDGGGERGVQGFGGNPEGRRPLRKHRSRWEDNIKMDLQEVGCGGTDWIEIVQDRDR
jgi:hypothetical protein